jgi:hypothetical protein
MPGLFTNYLTYPYRFAEYFRPFETQIDFNKRRALTLDGGDNDRITLTTVQDFANVVSRAVEYEGEWPVVGGIRGPSSQLATCSPGPEDSRYVPYTIHFVLQPLSGAYI